MSEREETGSAGHLPDIRVARPGTRRSLSRSATRALDVLEHFGEMRRPLRAMEIGQALSLHPSTTNQLLKTMVESAHLTFDARSKTYLPSPRLGAFASWVVGSFGASPRVEALLREVHQATGHMVTLSTPNDTTMQIIEWVGEGAATEVAERGLRVSIFGTAIGTAYLTMLDEEAVARLAYRARLKPDEIAATADVLTVARERGIAAGASGGGEIRSLAAPLPGNGLAAPLVLGMAGPAAAVRGCEEGLREAILTVIARWAEERA